MVSCRVRQALDPGALNGLKIRGLAFLEGNREKVLMLTGMDRPSFFLSGLPVVHQVFLVG